MDMGTEPCHFIGWDSVIESIRVSGSCDFTLARVIGLATYNRLLLSTLKSPIPSSFILSKLLCLSFLPSDHHTLTYCDGTNCKLAMWLALGHIL